MSEASTRRFVRLALANSALRAARAIEAAANLARAMDADLIAAYIQDEDLLRAAALPCSFEIGSLASKARPYGLAEIERAMRREALDVERAVSDIAGRLGLGWTFEVLRGRAVDLPFRQSGSDQITVIGKSGLDLPEPSHRLAQARAAAPILAVTDTAPGAAVRLDRVLRNLGGSAPLAVWMPKTDERDAATMRTELQALAKGSGRTIRHIESAESFSAASLARTMRMLRPAVVIITRSLAEKIREELPVVLRLVAGTMIFAP